MNSREKNKKGQVDNGQDPGGGGGLVLSLVCQGGVHWDK